MQNLFSVVHRSRGPRSWLGCDLGHLGHLATTTFGQEPAITDDVAGQSTPMIITGERTVPGIWHENYWFRRHEVVYEFVADLVRERTVLEAGCGEGYGADRLTDVADSVVALDYDAYTTSHVRQAYPTLAVTRANLVAMPFADRSFGAVVSLQTVEHLWDQETFLAECARVCATDGLMLLSTPNTLTFPPGNPYHPHELTPDDLADLVRRHARLEQVLGLHHGPRLRAWEAEHGSIVDAQLAAPPGRWPDHVATVVRSVGADDFVLAGGDLAASLDLVAIARPDDAAGSLP